MNGAADRRRRRLVSWASRRRDIARSARTASPDPLLRPGQPSVPQGPACYTTVYLLCHKILKKKCVSVKEYSVSLSMGLICICVTFCLISGASNDVQLLWMELKFHENPLRILHKEFFSRYCHHICFLFICFFFIKFRNFALIYNNFIKVVFKLKHTSILLRLSCVTASYLHIEYDILLPMSLIVTIYISLFVLICIDVVNKLYYIIYIPNRVLVNGNTYRYHGNLKKLACLFFELPRV